MDALLGWRIERTKESRWSEILRQRVQRLLKFKIGVLNIPTMMAGINYKSVLQIPIPLLFLLVLKCSGLFIHHKRIQNWYKRRIELNETLGIPMQWLMASISPVDRGARGYLIFPNDRSLHRHYNRGHNAFGATKETKNHDGHFWSDARINE